MVYLQKIVVSFFFLVALGNTAYAAMQELPDTEPIKPIPHISMKILKNGVTVKTVRFSADPRLAVPASMLMTFRVYIYKDNVIAFSWQNAPEILDPFSMIEKTFPNVLKSMKGKLSKTPKYRFIAVMDFNAKTGISGVYYSPTLFPEGMTSLDLKW